MAFPFFSKPSRRTGPWLLALALGCGASSEGDDVPPGTDPEVPRFAILTTVFGADFMSRTSFIAFADDLGTGEIDLRNAIEISGPAALWAIEGTEEFYISSSESVSLRKYRFVDGEPVEVDALGFLAEGITSLFGELMLFDGPERAFFIELNSAQALELDLAQFEIVRSIDLSDWLDDSQPTFAAFNRASARGDGELVGTITGLDLVQETVSDKSQIVIFDLETGDFELLPSPCGGIGSPVRAENGDLFFSGDPYVAAVHAIDDSRSPAPCLVRLPAGSRVPMLASANLNELTGAPSGGLIPSGPNSAFIRVLDTATFPPTPESTAAQLFGVPFWQTWEIDLNDPGPATLVERQPALLAGGITWFEAGDAVYENVSASDFSTTTLYQTNAPEGPTPGAVIPGVPFSIVSLR